VPITEDFGVDLLKAKVAPSKMAEFIDESAYRDHPGAAAAGNDRAPT
jgi:hypothetical protein